MWAHVQTLATGRVAENIGKRLDWKRFQPMPTSVKKTQGLHKMSNDLANVAKCMVRSALKGALATLDAHSDAPYASMILFATTVEGCPLTLISKLARHTRNLHATAAASVLVDTSNAAGDANSGGRVSLIGTFSEDASPSSRARFLSRHPSAAEYADFADFSFFRMHIESAHVIEGFGRIVTLPGLALKTNITDPTAFADAEPSGLAELRRYWPTVTGFDPEGVDVMVDASLRRLQFPSPATDAVTARAAAAICLAAAMPS